MSLHRIQAVASNTTREAIRNRAFVGLMLMALAFLLFSMVLSELAVRGEGQRVILDFGYFAISLCGVVIAIVMGVILVHKEVEKKTIYTIIPKPVERYEFIVGKYLGMVAILSIGVGMMVGLWVFILWVEGWNISLDLFMASGLIFLEVMVIASVALLFSSFSSPVLSGIFTFGIFLIGRLSYLVEDMLNAKSGLFVTVPFLRPFGDGFLAICPDLKVFNVTQDLLLGIPIGGWYFGAAAVYALAYVVFFLCVAIVLFQRRDFI